MGTNYYFYTAERELPMDSGELEGDGRWRIHIGLSSAGWCFGLHIYPDAGIDDLPDWVKFFDSVEGRIEDEYHRLITVPQLLDIIRDRGSEELAKTAWEENRISRTGYYSGWADFHSRNNSFPGPRGMLRSKVDHLRCVKNGEGTWDCFVGEFS